MNNIIQGDCLEELKKLPDSSVDAIVTDPPYELGFMGKSWDSTGIANNKDMWKECFRVLKSGGYLLSFGGTRTYHRMASAIEDAGFEIRDMIEWVYGSGFPKSLNIGKKLPEWEGWGTALKPAHEPICMARKPLREKTVAENVLKYGTGGINIDESRVATDELTPRNNNNTETLLKKGFEGEAKTIEPSPLGRFPANLIHDNSEEVRECFPESKGDSKNRKPRTGTQDDTQYKFRSSGNYEINGYTDNGSSARFFKTILYFPKASKSERNKGCEELEEKEATKFDGGDFKRGNDNNAKEQTHKNNHPTVKPIALMEYLINMVTRKGQIVLDPFSGSGTTLIAAKGLGRKFIGIELEPEYVKIAEARIKGIPERLL